MSQKEEGGVKKKKRLQEHITRQIQYERACTRQIWDNLSNKIIKKKIN